MDTSGIHFPSELAELLKPLEHLDRPPLKLIIHAGTPKTGTTSIQTYLDKNQRKLRGQGILYPHNIDRIRHPHAPKHQWFEKNLVTTHVEYFLENFRNIVSQVKEDTHTIILSSEGIFNYWWDFPDESKALLSDLGTHFDTEIWTWFRDPLEFIEGFYKQCIRNPQVSSNPCYGKDISFAEMLELEWFSQHLNYQGFVSECQELFGKSQVIAFQYEGDVVLAFKRELGLQTLQENSTPRLNKGLNATAIALLRVINSYDVKAKDKERLMPHLREVGDIIECYANETLVDDESRKKVLEIARPIQF